MSLTKHIENELNKRVSRAETLIKIIESAKLAECELLTLKDEIKTLKDILTFRRNQG